jgi:hypothetical protein
MRLCSHTTSFDSYVLTEIRSPLVVFLLLLSLAALLLDAGFWIHTLPRRTAHKALESGLSVVSEELLMRSLFGLSRD